MALNLNNYSADIRSFDLSSQRRSILTGNEIHDCYKEDRRQFLDTVPLDSDSMDDRPANLDLDTQVLYDSDHDDHSNKSPAFDHGEEMVLDSEDEEMDGSRVVIVSKSSLASVTKRAVKGDPLLTNSNGSLVSEQHLSGKGVYFMDTRECNGNEAAPYENICIQDSEEWCQADALEFVDRFVSTNRIDLSQEISNRRNFRQKSLTVLGLNGPQKLAREIYMRAQAKGQQQFKWFDYGGLENSRRNTKSISDSKGCKKNVVPYLNKEEGVVLDHLELGFAASHVNAGCKMSEISEASTAVAELELARKQSEDHDVVRDNPHIYDIGFNTQLAAEAIEELAYANPFGYRSSEACQDVAKTVYDPLRGVMENDCMWMSVYKDIGEVFHNAKRKKRSERKFCRGISSSSDKQSEPQKIDLDLKTVDSVSRSKFFSKSQLCVIGYNSNEISGRNPHKLIEQSDEQQSSITNTGNSMIPLTTVKTSLLADLQSKGRFNKVYSRTRRPTQVSSGVNSKTNDDQASNHREKTKVNTEHGMVVYRRKRSRVNSNPCISTPVKEKCSELCDSDDGAGNRNLTSFSKLGMWNYPKGKRTRSNVCPHPIGTHDLNAPENLHFQDEMMSNFNKKKKKKSSSCTRNLPSKSFDKLDLQNLNSEKNRASKVVVDKTPQLLHSKCTTVSSKTRRNFASSNCMSYDNQTRSHNNSIRKTPLLKKLSNPGHMTEFVWKNLRRRKDIADVRVLFSQHLDIDIIKHLKKVAARLGISVVSCSMDATHFIADDFARTKNMLEAIALGKPVVTHQWLESCGQANCFVDETNYILRDAKKEQEIGFCMPASLARAKQHPLLEGRKVLVTPNIKPDKEMIMNLVEAVNGQLVNEVQTYRLKDKDAPEDLLILSCKEDYQICQPFLIQGAAVYSSELLLNSIVTQKLEYKRHRLFANDVKRNCI